MYQQSPILGALALAAFIICAVATGVIVIMWLVEHYWIPQSSLDESWLYGEDTTPVWTSNENGPTCRGH